MTGKPVMASWVAPMMPTPGQEHDDPGGDDARRVHLERRGRGGDRDEGGDEAPGRLQVEGRDAEPGQQPLRSVDRARRQERQQAHHRAAAEGEGDTGPHHAPPQRHRPASSEVSGGDDPGDLVASLATGDATGDQVGHRLVDLGQVRVVDLAPGHPPDLDGGGLVDARLVVKGQVDEGHVRGHVAHARRRGSPPAWWPSRRPRRRRTTAGPRRSATPGRGTRRPHAAQPCPITTPCASSGCRHSAQRPGPCCISRRTSSGGWRSGPAPAGRISADSNSIETSAVASGGWFGVAKPW